MSTWPTPQDYNEAVQCPALSFFDTELKAGVPELTPDGLPRPISGAFATVYRLSCHSREWAVRCFLHRVKDQSERYARVSEFISQDDLPYTVGFEYLTKGILVRGNWYPILKMEWVEGSSLIDFIENNLDNTVALANLAESFKQMCISLSEAGIAHGDLQHGNILMVGDELRLVDYDGMFVPALAGYASSELGHRNYQHPGREANDFAHHLDRFANWSIYTSLKCLSLDPTLWRILGAGDECLLFRHLDYLDPAKGHAFRLLEEHEEPEISLAAKQLRFLLFLKLNDIPELRQTELQQALRLPDLPPYKDETPHFDAGTTDAKTNLAYDITGTWQGQYKYDGFIYVSPPCSFEAKFSLINGDLTGTTKDGKGGHGSATVTGKFNYPTITFQKKYAQSSLARIEYVGSISQDGTELSGTWKTTSGTDSLTGKWKVVRIR